MAAPAIVRAEETPSLTVFMQSNIKDRIFDLRGGTRITPPEISRVVAFFDQCQLICCTFMLDEFSYHVVISACNLLNCRIEGMREFGKRKNSFMNNYVEDSFLDELPASLPEPTTYVGNNIIYGSREDRPLCPSPIS